MELDKRPVSDYKNRIDSLYDDNYLNRCRLMKGLFDLIEDAHKIGDLDIDSFEVISEMIDMLYFGRVVREVIQYGEAFDIELEIYMNC